MVFNDTTSSVTDFHADFNDCFQSKLKASGTAGCLKVTVTTNDNDGSSWRGRLVVSSTLR